MQKANELCDVYHELYFQLNQEPEEARSLQQEYKDNAVYGSVNF